MPRQLTGRRLELFHPEVCHKGEVPLSERQKSLLDFSLATPLCGDQSDVDTEVGGHLATPAVGVSLVE